MITYGHVLDATAFVFEEASPSYMFLEFASSPRFTRGNDRLQLRSRERWRYYPFKFKLRSSFGAVLVGKRVKKIGCTSFCFLV